MKTNVLFILWFFSCFLVLLSCSNNSKSNEDLTKIEVFTREDSLKAPEFSFMGSSYDFGTIKEGTEVNHFFKFKNIGHTPLIITKILTSCGCTTPDFSPRPIGVSDTGSFHIRFDSQGKQGPQTKIITIFANTIPRIHRVVLVGVVNHK